MKELRVLQIKTDCASCVNKCCSQPYDWVYLTANETDRLQEASGVSPAEFMSERQNTTTGHLIRTLDLPCRFFDQATGQCSVYEARPLACRMFPFYLDPLTGTATLYAAECGDYLLFPDNDSGGSWRLADLEEEAHEWIVEFWKDAAVKS
jgi:Fe-S-cluster containining protein